MVPSQNPPARHAIISVADKTGLTPLAECLAQHGFSLYATGGTSSHLTQASIRHHDITTLTNMPELLDGRVKTLHPAILGGILADRNTPKHAQDLAKHGIQPIDLVVCNLYRFFDRLQDTGDLASLIEAIDIGGVTLLRASAKNHAHVAIISDPDDYPAIIDELTTTHSISQATRTHLAAKAMAYTAAYDSAISHWLADKAGCDFPPRHFTLGGILAQPLRYGENPDQSAAIYRVLSAPRPPRLIQGKPLGYNNLLDGDRACHLVTEFARPSIAIIKHGNPCGVAVADTLITAWQHAYAADPVSAFGGIVASNRPVDADFARAIADKFTEAIIAPGFDQAAVTTLAGKRLLVVDMPNTPHKTITQIRQITGGFLAQTQTTQPAEFKIVTHRHPSPQEKTDLLFAWRVVKHVASNAIVFASRETTKAIGAGQMSRIDAIRIAIAKAEELAGKQNQPLKNSCLASDGFFPFADSIAAAAETGVTAIIQPGGSKRDAEVIAAANTQNIAMAFTAQRVFRH